MNQTVIGIPRGMLFYRYETLWRTFFTVLGLKVVESEPTTQHTAQEGMQVTIDEACLALKIYFGHVASLVGRCDLIFVPRVCNFGLNREFCSRFAALYDMTNNLFRQKGVRLLTCCIDEREGKTQQDAFFSIGHTLGFTAKATKAAYKAALRQDVIRRKAELQLQAALWKQEGIKILIAAHSYVIEDAFIGKPVTDFLKNNGAVPIRADIADRDLARARALEMSPTCKWELNREILGGVNIHQKKADGLILLSTFPCGPDAMVNELLLRRTEGLPMLQLVVDGQSGTAGLETRLESFLDIIRFQKGAMA